MEDVRVLAAIRAAYGTSTALPGLAPDLVVREPEGWTSADTLAGDLLLGAAQRRWAAPPHVAVALLWRAYSLWLSVPAAFAWVAARRVPHLTAADVLVRLDAPVAPVRLGLRDSYRTSVLPGDALADREERLFHPPPADGTRPAEGARLAGRPGILVLPDESALLAALRRVLLDEHVSPMLDNLQRTVRISRRLLLGSLAAGMAHAGRHAVRAVPGASPDDVGTLLAALGLTNLIDWSADPAGLVTVRRRTCCLAFTLPQPRFCGDCCYVPRPGGGPAPFSKRIPD